MNTEKIKAALGDVIIEEISVPKNNGIILKGVQIKKDGSNIAPVVYIPNDLKDDDEIAEYIIDTYKKEGIISSFDFEFSKDSVMSNVYPVIVNAERNDLTKIVSTPFLDLAVIYKIDVNVNGRKGCITIRNEHLKYLDVSVEELHLRAIKNVQSNGRIIDMNCMFPFDIDDKKILIVTSKDTAWGTGSIFDKEVIEKLKEELGDTFYLIPSSVHEFLAIPADHNTLDFLINLVGEVNRSEVKPQDYLSDNVYFYNGEKLEVAS